MRKPHHITVALTVKLKLSLPFQQWTLSPFGRVDRNQPTRWDLKRLFGTENLLLGNKANPSNAPILLSRKVQSETGGQ